MSTSLHLPLKTFVDSAEIITGAVLADLDGTYVTVYPDEHKETLCHCAVFTGVAIRRASLAELRAGRGPVHEISLDGETGSVLAIRVSDEHQLVTVLKDFTPANRIREAAHRVAKLLAQSINPSPSPKGATTS